LIDFIWIIFYSVNDKRKRRVTKNSPSGKLMFTLCVFGLQLSLETLLKEEVMLSVVLDGSSLVDHTLESLHGDV
jgi:hypothetical protein